MARSEVTTRPKAYSREPPNKRTRKCGACGGKIPLLQPVVIKWDGEHEIIFYHAAHVIIWEKPK